MRHANRNQLRLGLFGLVSIPVVACVALILWHHSPSGTEAKVEQQAQVPAPMGAIWCKSADECPQRHVRRPE